MHSISKGKISLNYSILFVLLGSFWRILKFYLLDTKYLIHLSLSLSCVFRLRLIPAPKKLLQMPLLILSVKFLCWRNDLRYSLERHGPFFFFFKQSEVDLTRKRIVFVYFVSFRQP